MTNGLTETQKTVLAFFRERPTLSRVELVRALANARQIRLTTARAHYDRLVAKGVLGPAACSHVPLLRDLGRFLTTVEVSNGHRDELQRLRERVLEAGG